MLTTTRWSLLIQNTLGLLLLILINACGGGNTLPLSVGNCGANSYANEPCVNVTVCTPGTSTCQTIPNVILDTGSYGLRVFSSLVTVGLTQTTSGGGQIAECTGFAQGTSDWGPVELADVQLGGEKAASVPIQLINSAYGRIPASCSNPDTSPSSSGYNGILGIGPMAADCGTSCSSSASNGNYFTCNGSNCQGAAIAVAQQVTNPIVYFPTDNNGLMITLPSITNLGVSSSSGTVVFGVGTQGNNTPPTGVTVLAADETGNIITQYNGQTYSSSFLDTGSNGIFFPGPSSLPACSTSGTASGFYCPSATQTFSAVQMGISKATSSTISFQILNANSALSSTSQAFDNLGGSATDSFDWGLPFFFGRSVFLGIDGKASSLGSNAYYAY
jgi:hypothetical protein